MAIAHSPITRLLELPSFTSGRPFRRNSHDGEVVRLVDAEHLSRVDRAVAHHDRHLRCARDDVGVGDDHAVRSHDEARAESRMTCAVALARRANRMGPAAPG